MALLYRKSMCSLIDSKPCHIQGLSTRDILLAHFTDSKGEDFAVLVNHHPSKYGGGASDDRRQVAVRRLGELADSLKRVGIERIIAMGDFNDTPDKPIFSGIGLYSLALPLHKKGMGSIKYDGKWELIDMFFSTDSTARMTIPQIPFLLTKDKTGQKPLRTYSGPRYLGGVSDHLPVWLER